MGGAVLTNSIAAHVSAAFPTTNFHTQPNLGIRTGGGGDAYGYLYFPRPFPLAATIISARIVFYTMAMTSATHTFTFQRLNQSFSASKVTYNTRPTALIAGTKPVTKVGVLADDVEWEIDVADWMQTLSGGGVNYGMRIIVNEAITRWIRSENYTSAQFRPRLEVTWSDAPATPAGLAPSAGRKVGVSKPILRATYLDVSGATSLLAAQVQMNATDVWNPVAPGPAFDSGTVLTSVPEIDLTQSFANSRQFGTTNTSTNITGAAGNFETADIGAAISGTNIPGGTTITAVAGGGGSATISAAATGTGTTIGTITRTHPGLTDGQIVFWRIRLQDAAGLWSPWSSATTFQYDTKGVLSVSNPPSGTPTVEDTTPPIIWSFTGETQAAYQVQITHTANGRPVLDWDSGKVTSTVTTVTVPAGKITEVGSTFTVTVRIWDNKQREATPGSPTYSEVVRAFTFTPGATVGTTGLTAVSDAIRPKAVLTWQRATAPDSFSIVRNGKVIQSGLLPGDIFVSGTTYTWTDNAPSPSRSLTYSVQGVVGGVASATNATAVVTVRSTGIWLREPTLGLEVHIAQNDDREFVLGETSAVLQSIAQNANKVPINQSLGGLEGRVEGQLITIHGKTAQEWRDQYLQMRALRVKRFYLTIGDYTFVAVCQEFTYAQRGIGEAVFRVSFMAYQQDSINSVLASGSGGAEATYLDAYNDTY